MIPLVQVLWLEKARFEDFQKLSKLLLEYHSVQYEIFTPIKHLKAYITHR